MIKSSLVNGSTKQVIIPTLFPPNTSVNNWSPMIQISSFLQLLSSFIVIQASSIFLFHVFLKSRNRFLAYCCVIVEAPSIVFLFFILFISAFIILGQSKPKWLQKCLSSVNIVAFIRFSDIFSSFVQLFSLLYKLLFIS